MVRSLALDWNTMYVALHAAIEWYLWGVFLWATIAAVATVCLGPFWPYRQYPAYWAARRIVIIMTVLLMAFVGGVVVYGAPFGTVLEPKDTSLFRLVSFGSIVLFGVLLRLHLIKKMLRPPPTHPAYKHPSIF